MELEIVHLDRRYEALRARNASRERRLMAAIADVGQQTPIVVVRDGERWVVVDGYKRVRVLARLGHDTASATVWDLTEADALLLERVLRAGEGDSAFEQGWLILELSTRFGLSLEELARRFDKTKSWVSRRLSLVCDLPAPVVEHVRAGAICPHAAMKYLVPLARANSDDCVRLCDAIAPERLTSRQVGELYAAYLASGPSGREFVVTQPATALRAHKEAAQEREQDKRPVEHLLDDLRILAAVARRAKARLKRGALDDAEASERDEARRSFDNAQAELESLARCFAQEGDDAG